MGTKVSIDHLLELNENNPYLEVEFHKASAIECRVGLDICLTRLHVGRRRVDVDNRLSGPRVQILEEGLEQRVTEVKTFVVCHRGDPNGTKSIDSLDSEVNKILRYCRRKVMHSRKQLRL